MYPSDDQQSHVVGYSSWFFFCALVSVFGFAGYYGEVLGESVPAWLFVIILVSPIAMILFVQWGELPDRIVKIVHLVAASMILAAAIGMEVLIALGHRPEGMLMMRIFVHVGWTFAWAAILRRAWRHKVEENECSE